MKEKILEALNSVKHPAINLSLIDLGILQNIKIEDNKVKATLAWPFDLVPPAIKQMIVNSIENAIKPYGLTFEYDERLMNEDEKQRFLKLEHDNWKGF
jgi:metal-sulfur cluster biosynthetic enzyme